MVDQPGLIVLLRELNGWLQFAQQNYHVAQQNYHVAQQNYHVARIEWLAGWLLSNNQGISNKVAGSKLFLRRSDTHTHARAHTRTHACA
jgi:hypothetical protein